MKKLYFYEISKKSLQIKLFFGPWKSSIHYNPRPSKLKWSLKVCLHDQCVNPHPPHPHHCPCMCKHFFWTCTDAKVYATYSALKFPNVGNWRFRFKQNRHRLWQRQHLGNVLVHTLFCSSSNFSFFSTSRAGTSGLVFSLITCFSFHAFIGDDTNVKSWGIGSLPGCHSPNLLAEISCNSCFVSSFAFCKSWKAHTPSRSGFPRILWQLLSPVWQAKVNVATSSKSNMLFGSLFLEDFWHEVEEHAAIVVRSLLDLSWLSIPCWLSFDWYKNISHPNMEFIRKSGSVTRASKIFAL